MYFVKNLQGENKLHKFNSQGARLHAIKTAVDNGFKVIVVKLRPRKNINKTV